jgi:hypothetical protein
LLLGSLMRAACVRSEPADFLETFNDLDAGAGGKGGADAIAEDFEARQVCVFSSVPSPGLTRLTSCRALSPLS